jgi:hypothetical protein
MPLKSLPPVPLIFSKTVFSEELQPNDRNKIQKTGWSKFFFTGLGKGANVENCIERQLTGTVKPAAGETFVLFFSFLFSPQVPSHGIHGPGKERKKKKKPVVGKSFFINNINPENEGNNRCCQPENFHYTVIALHELRITACLPKAWQAGKLKINMMNFYC